MALLRVSGLWIKDGRNGKFMSGSVQDLIPAGAKLLVFKNDKKRWDKDPDYTLHVADEDSNGQSDSRPPDTQPARNRTGASNGGARGDVSTAGREALSDF